MQITPIILAAGDSSRMGFPKALLPFGGRIFLTHILNILDESEVPGAIVVLGAQAELIRPFLAGRQSRVVVNPEPQKGQLSSIKLALEAVSPSSRGVLIWPVDQPAVSSALIRSLTQLFFNSGALIVLPSYGGRNGHPAIIHHSLFRELLDAPTAEGSKGVIRAHRAQTAIQSTDESGVTEDVDTPADYERLTGRTLELALEEWSLLPNSPGRLNHRNR